MENLDLELKSAPYIQWFQSESDVVEDRESVDSINSFPV